MPPHLIRRKDRGKLNWYIKDGKRRLSTKTSKKTLAELVLRQYTERRLGVFRPSTQKISQLVGPYLEHCSQFNKRSTIDDKRRTLVFFGRFTGDSLIRRVQRETIQHYLTARRVGGVSSERWNTERQILNNFFVWLMGQSAIDFNPVAGVPKQKIVKGKIPRDLSSGAELGLLKFLRHNDSELYRMSLLVGNTGLRSRELANLQPQDIDWRHGLLFVRSKADWTPKDYEERSIPLNSRAQAALRIQYKQANGATYLFTRKDGRKYGRGLDVRMGRACRAAGLPRGGFHQLRHTFATRAVMSGMDLETLRKLMGHSDTKTLAKYLWVKTEHVAAMARKIKFG